MSLPVQHFPEHMLFLPLVTSKQKWDFLLTHWWCVSLRPWVLCSTAALWASHMLSILQGKTGGNFIKTTDKCASSSTEKKLMDLSKCYMWYKQKSYKKKRRELYPQKHRDKMRTVKSQSESWQLTGPETHQYKLKQMDVTLWQYRQKELKLQWSCYTVRIERQLK